MPNQSANLTALRTDGHHLRAYLSVYVGAEVLAGTVDSTPTYPVTNIVYTLTSGTSANVNRGYRVDILTSGGVFKGRTRVRFAGVLSDANIPIREMGIGTIEIEGGDILKVYEEIRLGDKLTDATQTFDPDGITYTDQTDLHRPVACSGGVDAGFVDSGQTYRTVQFTGSTSFAVDPDTVSAVTHSWTFPAGSTPTSSTSADPSVQIPVGSHLIEHIVTDPDNSTTQAQYIPVMVHDDSSLPLECLIDTLSADVDSGWSATVQVFENATLADIPDGALAVLWKEEFIAGSQQSFGAASSGRSHLILVGYLRADDTQGDADLDELRFDVQSPIALLEETFGTSKVFEGKSLPDIWQDFRSLNTQRAIIHLFQWYTRLFESGFDLIFPSSTYFYVIATSALYLQTNSPLAMAREVADTADARVVCDRTGRVIVHTRPPYIKETDRSGVVTTLTLADDDIIDYAMHREHQRPIAIYRGRGIVATANQSAFAKWPGEAPGELRETLVQDKILFIDLTDLYERTGLRGAAADGVIWQTDNSVEFVSSLDLTLFGSYDVFDFYQEYIELNLLHTNLRGFLWNGITWWLRSIDVTYNDGTAETNLRLAPVTLGPPGVDDTPPPNTINYNPPPPITFGGTLPGDTGLVAGTGNIVLVLSDGFVAVTTNFTDSSPTWDLRDFTADLGTAVTGYSYKATATNITAWIVTLTEIILAENLQDVSPTFTVQHTFVDTYDTGGVDSDFIFEPGQFAVVNMQWTGGGNDFSDAFWTRNGGTTWNGPELLSSTSDAPFGAKVIVSPRTAGKAWAGAEAGDNNGTVYVSTDYGANWVEETDATRSKNIGMSGLHQGFSNPGTETIFYSSGQSGGSTGTRQFRRLVGDTIGSKVETIINPTSGGDIYAPDSDRLATASADDDANKIAIACIKSNAGPERGIFITANALAATPSWTELVAPASSVDYNRLALVSHAAELYAFGIDGAIAHSPTPFVPGSLNDKIGGLSTTGTVIGIAGY